MNEDDARTARRFDPKRLFEGRFAGHGATLGIEYHNHGADWAELALPYAQKLIGAPATGVIASGPILALMDMATSVAVWLKLDLFKPHATLDLRIDYLRPARAGRTVIGRGECYRITRSVAFVRGQAHDGDPDNPVANVAATFMAVEGYR
ncbi:PaaI family thioesterase [Sphingomonas xinjiangensis]|uniref:Uncharacterized protein (TIGR00369 family) n=1 Tax=Sphingomonas xinjiangensis TaxID=643568 RepID=A0A840YNB5_9SPHN|nr:PaaI family thioesterase [Sphingomonas xinjiangensis]MBB5711676.1 uncharacterized protein (TIGR00369 family) [Sphingomonas xinjiangensis]